MNKSEFVKSLQVLEAPCFTFYADSPMAIKPLWHAGYWDGPINGLCQLKNGRRAWFDVANDFGDSIRIYAVTALSDAELEVIERNHRLFQEHVGNHTEYEYDEESERYYRKVGELKPRDKWRSFYDTAEDRAKSWALVKVEDPELLGWFVWK